MSIDNLTRKERERQFRKNEILQAAEVLFADKGYEHTTLDEIAVASEFGKGTIYNYFANKEEIYFEILRRSINEYVQIFEESFNETNGLKQFFLNYTKRMFKYSLENIHIFRIHVRIKTQIDAESINFCKDEFNEINDKLSSMLNERINKAIEEGEIINLDSNSVINAFRAITMPYLTLKITETDPLEIDYNAEAEFLINVLFNGISKK